MEYRDELLMLPFDHRASFSKGLLGYTPPLTDKQHERVSEFKRIVFDGFLKARLSAKTLEACAILVDEEFGTPILTECKTKGIGFAVSVEKSGQEFFDFEYGKEYAKHLLALKPTFAKVLVRFNPKGDKKGNATQLARLKTLSEFCEKAKVHLMFELLVPPTKAQQKSAGKTYDKKLRPRLMVDAILAITASGIKPAVWKIEALETHLDWERVITATRSAGGKPGIIVLGRGEDEKKVDEWIVLGAGIREVTGFAVGRTVFNPPLVAYRDGKATHQQAAQMIAKNYKRLITLWERSRTRHA